MTASDPSLRELQNTISALQQRVAELERERDQATQRAELFEAIVNYNPLRITVYHLERPDDPRSLRLVAINPAAQPRSANYDLKKSVGKLMVEIFPNAVDSDLERYVAALRSGQPQDLGELRYTDESFGEICIDMQALPLPNDHLGIVYEDVTARKRAEEALRQVILQEELINAQQATLAELSTPLIPISDQVMVMPLIGSVDSRRAQQVLETLLEGIASSGAQYAILDITGVPVVDTQVANALIRAAQAVKLLGAQVVLTGIRPEVAQTLVGLGADLGGITTRSSLQSGIAYANIRN